MAATRTPGITIDTDGNYFIDKCHRGTRVCRAPTSGDSSNWRISC